MFDFGSLPGIAPASPVNPSAGGSGSSGGSMLGSIGSMLSDGVNDIYAGAFDDVVDTIPFGGAIVSLADTAGEILDPATDWMEDIPIVGGITSGIKDIVSAIWPF